MEQYLPENNDAKDLWNSMVTTLKSGQLPSEENDFKNLHKFENVQLNSNWQASFFMTETNSPVKTDLWKRTRMDAEFLSPNGKSNKRLKTSSSSSSSSEK
jgi:hypothetical protein